MNIVYLEDSSELRADIVASLRDNRHQVADFYAIDEAKEYFEGNPSVDCIITDLNMDDDFLGEYRKESNGGVLSGWVWLRRFVWENERYANVPCVFYSGYIGYFEDYLEKDREAKRIFNDHRTAIIRKGKGYNHNRLNEILKELVYGEKAK